MTTNTVVLEKKIECFQNLTAPPFESVDLKNKFFSILQTLHSTLLVLLFNIMYIATYFLKNC